jgi:regulator of replication initiation timing
MVKQAAAVRAVDLEPIDRLEEKIKLLVAMVTRLRAEQAKAAEDNARLTQEIAALRARLADSEGATSEIAALRGERETIRTRVSDMLEQLEHLNI